MEKLFIKRELVPDQPGAPIIKKCPVYKKIQRLNHLIRVIVPSPQIMLAVGCLLFAVPLFAQTFVDSTLIGRQISSIQVFGNKKTKSHVVLREMKQSAGDTLDLALLEGDRKRIQDLNIFNRVIIIGQPDDGLVHLTVAVTEFWYIFPYPILHINDRDWKKISYGAGVTHLNFRGRAEHLTFQFKLGYNPLVELGYINPWFGGTKRLRANINAVYKKVRSKHFEKNENRDVDEKHIGFGGYFGRRFGHHIFPSIFAGYTQISYTPPVEGKTISSTGTDRFPILGLFFTWDHRDLKEYPSKGWYVRSYVLKKGIPGNQIDYLKTGIDLRGYLPLKWGSTLALRSAADMSSGTIPVYDRVFLGYGERIRGHFFEKFEGENRAIAGMALRFPVLPIRYYDAAKQYFLSDFRFGINMGLFVDTGLTWYQNEKITKDKMISGAGAGLHFFLPYALILRFEIAFNENGKTQFYIDLNVDI